MSTPSDSEAIPSSRKSGGNLRCCPAWRPASGPIAPWRPVLPPIEFSLSNIDGSCSRCALAAEPKSQIRGRPVASDQGPALALVECPIADLGGGGVADVRSLK